MAGLAGQAALLEPLRKQPAQLGMDRAKGRTALRRRQGAGRPTGSELPAGRGGDLAKVPHVRIERLLPDATLGGTGYRPTMIHAFLQAFLRLPALGHQLQPFPLSLRLVPGQPDLLAAELEVPRLVLFPVPRLATGSHDFHPVSLHIPSMGLMQSS